MELLPAQRQADGPDDQRAQAVQHHAGGGADFLGDADAGEVEEGDADCVAQQCQQDEWLMVDLAEGVQGVLQHLAGVVTELAHVDEVHGDEQQRQDNEAKQAWTQRAGLVGVGQMAAVINPTDCLLCGKLVSFQST